MSPEHPAGPPPPAGAPDRPGRLEGLLGLFTAVRPGEGSAALTLLAAVFLMLAAYYFIKPAREGWLAVSPVEGLSKIEVRAYSSFAQSLVLALAVHVYSRMVARHSRRFLVTAVGLFFASHLLLFWLMQPGLLAADLPYAGVAFYLWVGIFNVFVITQFWSFVADFYDDERGRRLVPLVALGATAGAVSGSWLSDGLVRLAGADTYDLLLAAIPPLLLSVALVRRAMAIGPAGHGASAPVARTAPSPSTRGALAVIRRHPFLVAAALVTVIFGWAGSNGENVLFGLVQRVVEERGASLGLAGAALQGHVRDATTAFYGSYYFWINTCALLLQAFVVSRMMRFGGFGLVFLALPVLTLFGYAAMAVVPTLFLLRLVKVAENSTSYSVHNTARHVLWLPTTAEMKYKAKQAIDTVGVRVGDGLAALTVLLGIQVLGRSPVELLWVNVALGAVWGALAIFLVRERARLVEEPLLERQEGAPAAAAATAQRR